MCPLCVISWEWDDEEGLLVWSDETGSWALGVPGADEGLTVTRDILAELLPHSATVQTAVEFKSAELVWDLNQIPAEGAFQGTYTLTASLADTPEGPYALVDGVPAMEVLVVLGGGEAYAQSTPFNVALNEWEWEGFDSGATAVLAINKDNIQTVQDLIAAIRLSAPKRIYGWATGDKSVNDGAYTYADKQE